MLLPATLFQNVVRTLFRPSARSSAQAKAFGALYANPDEFQADGVVLNAHMAYSKLASLFFVVFVYLQDTYKSAGISC